MFRCGISPQDKILR